MEYSLFALEFQPKQTQLLKTCRESGVAVVAYSLLGRGMLLGKYRSPADSVRGTFEAAFHDGVRKISLRT